MITVMLADDNKFALKHFAGLVEWEKLGFELIDTAIDGIEAWDKFCRLFPDCSYHGCTNAGDRWYGAGKKDQREETRDDSDFLIELR